MGDSGGGLLLLIFFILFMCVWWFFVTFIKGTTNRNFKTDDESFSQAGVSVFYETQKITIKGNTFDASKVRAIRWEKEDRDQVSSKVYIELDDFKYPRFEIYFGLDGAEEFCTRLRLALEKAGASFVS